MKKLFIYIIALLPGIFWGMSFIWTKIVFRYYGPITTIFFRLLISVIILTLFIFWKNDHKIKKEDYKRFFILAIFQPFLYFLGENFGVYFVSPTIASLVVSTIPVITPIFAYFLINEKLNIYNISGLIISFLGVVLVLTASNSSLQFSLKGVSILIVAVFSGVGYAIIAKPLTKKYSSLSIVWVQNLIGVFLFLPLFLGFEFNEFIATPITRELTSSLLALAVFASSLAFISMTTAIRHLGVNRTNVFLNLVPVVTAIGAFIVMGTSLALQEIIGILIVVVGLLLTQFKGKTKDKTVHEK